ncbi:MAG TPA: phosphotransferase [Bacillales bacterium]|nr:phosphotransferase [Bacillales bacterium]
MGGNLGPILFQYQLYPNEIETIGKVKKLFTAKGKYALKETEMSMEQRTWFLHVIERLNRLGFDRFVAPFSTKYGEPLAMHNGKMYYVMPWVEDKDPGILSLEERLIETAAALHILTEKEQDYSTKIVESSYDALIGRWKAHEKEIEKFAAAAESKIYFSQFEFSFRSYFTEAIEAADAAKQYLSRWRACCKKERRFRVVLCHGKLSPSHFIDGQLLNLEHAVLDSPVRDLALLLRSSIMRGVPEQEDPFDWLQTYEERFALRKEEKFLLGAYLLFPEPVYRSIREYWDSQPEENKHVPVLKLEHRLKGVRELRRLAKRLLDAAEGQ